MSEIVVNIHQKVIDRCIKGDRSAQYELFRLYHKAMYNTAKRICGTAEDAEDVLQEAFLTAFSKIKQYKGDATFGAWLKMIVVNKSLSFLKKRNKMMFSAIDEHQDSFYYDWDEIPEQDMNIRAIRKAIDELPDGFRTVMSLYLFEGYDHQEISEILGITTSTSKSQFNRAKQKVRELISQQTAHGRSI